MSNTFNIKNTRGTVIATILETDKNTNSTSLVLHGRGAEEYGFDRDQNLVFMLENFSSTTPPSNGILGQLWWKFGDELFVRINESGDESGSPWTAIIPPRLDLGFRVIGGAGFGSPEGGLPVGSPRTVTLNLGEGTGITITANAVSTVDSEILHDSLSGFVANEHIDHSTVIITAGAGLVFRRGSGQPALPSGDITVNCRLDVVAGSGGGLQATGPATDVMQVDNTVVRTSGAQNIAGIKTFEEAIRVPDGTAALPAYTFSGDEDTGMYLSNPNELSFTTNGIQKFRIESDGTLRSTISNYETLVNNDEHIPNKKYVDDNAPTGSGDPTANILNVGTSFISGLTIGKKYLIYVSGFGIFKGQNNKFKANMNGVLLTRGNVSGRNQFITQGPSVGNIDWPDGNPVQNTTFIITAPSTSVAGAMDYGSDPLGRWGGATRFDDAMYMTAVRLS